MKVIRRALLLGLCLALLAGSALAEGFVNLGGEGCDQLWYRCSLADGRFILAGLRGEPGHYMNHKARLLCMNPDGTVSWEYIDPEGQSGMYSKAVVTDDGRICAVFDDSPYQDTQAMSLKFFTPDGQPEGKPVPLDFSLGMEYWLTSRGLLTRSYNYGLNRCEYIEFMAWNGRTLFRRRGGLPVSFGPDDGVIAEDDGLVLYGSEPDDEGTAAKIMKVDYDGNILWSSILPLETDMGSACLGICERTQDGRYIGRGHELSGNNYTYWKAVFSADGRVLSRKEISYDDNSGDETFDQDMMTEFRGKYMAMEVDSDGTAQEWTYRYLWFDADGNELGTTEVRIGKDTLPVPVYGADYVSYGGGDTISAGDYLWMLFTYRENNDDLEKEMGSCEVILARVPVL